jgi:hypothetical protein
MTAQSKEMAEQLSFEQRKIILKLFWEFKNVCEVPREWQREFAAELPTRLKISRIREKFDADGTQATTWEALHWNESRLFGYGVGIVYTIITKVRKATNGYTGLQRADIFMWTRRLFYQDHHAGVKLDRSF